MYFVHEKTVIDRKNLQVFGRKKPTGCSEKHKVLACV